jgi:putative transposase
MIVGQYDRVANTRGLLLDLVDDWAAFLGVDQAEEEVLTLRRHFRTGRPLGNEGFILRLETSLNRRLRRQKPGPKRSN